MHYYLLATLSLAICCVTTNAQEFAGPQLMRLPPTEEAIAPVVNAAEVESPLPAPVEEAKPADAATAEEIKPTEEIAPPSDEMLVNDEDWWFVPASWYKPLKGSIELGLNGTEGNSQTFNIRAGANATYNVPWVKHTYEIIHIDNSSDGVQTALNGYFDGRMEFPLSETQWSYFIHSRFEYDEFRDYDARISGDTGLAYDFWKNDKGNLQMRFGASTSREIGGTDTNFVPEATAGLDFKHQINEYQIFSLKSDYYPSVEEFSNYRINSNASWEIIVSKAWGLSAKLSIIDRYDNTPNSRKPNDLNYSALMLWAF